MKWDSRFMELAKLVASWSKDGSTKVGAVIVDEQRRIVSTGYNGPPQGVKDEYADRTQKLRRTLHAETNALAFAQRNVRGCTIYVTHPPCSQCAAQIIQHGIRKVVYPPPHPEFLQRWGVDHKEACAMFHESGVQISLI